MKQQNQNEIKPLLREMIKAKLLNLNNIAIRKYQNLIDSFLYQYLQYLQFDDREIARTISGSIHQHRLCG